MAETQSYEVPAFIAITLGFIVFFVGESLTRRIAFLRNFNIPEPVSGGIAIALLVWFYFILTDIQITFDLAVRDYLLVVFFSTIGLNARLSDLLNGGRLLLALLLITLCFIILQNIVGLVGAIIFELPRATGVLMGSAALIGGHGTAIAWGPTIQESTGFPAAAEIGIASATLGLVVAALIGGPIAKFLIDRNDLKADQSEDHIVGLDLGDTGERQHQVNHITLMNTLLVAHVTILLGWFVNAAVQQLGLKLPLFVPCLLVGILLSNSIPFIFKSIVWPARTKSMAVTSDLCLSVFLAMSLMSMQLWTLAELGMTLVGVLALQVAMTASVILFLVFRVLQRNYTAAVLCAGFAGFTLGATPTAIANMSSVTKSYGPAPLAFIVLPLVSAFFVDLANAFIIQYFASL